MTPRRAPLATPLPPSIRIVEDDGQLPRIEVATRTASAQVFFHGAQVTAWTPSHAARSVLWTSAHSHFRPDKPIRGGVPICFPWFGPHPTSPEAPAHGFVRLSEWTLRDAAELPDGTATLLFDREDDAETLRAWPHRFRVAFRLALGSTLRMALTVENRDAVAFTFEEALHSYFAVGDVGRVSVHGLEGTEYLDKVEDFARRRQGNDPIRFTAETDRVFLETSAPCEVADPALGRRIAIAKAASRSTVVWNPWIDRARSFPDFGDEEWREMVCVETANVGATAVQLPPGETHTISAEISVAPLPSR